MNVHVVMGGHIISISVVLAIVLVIKHPMVYMYGFDITSVHHGICIAPCLFTAVIALV